MESQLTRLMSTVLALGKLSPLACAPQEPGSISAVRTGTEALGAKWRYPVSSVPLPGRPPGHVSPLLSWPGVGSPQVNSV